MYILCYKYQNKLTPVASGSYAFATKKECEFAKKRFEQFDEFKRAKRDYKGLTLHVKKKY